MRRAFRLPLFVVAALAVISVGLWAATRAPEAPAEGVVTITTRAGPASGRRAPTTPLAAQQVNIPALPEKVIADIRNAYPLLTDVDFRCDAGGCAVTATIPPPPDQAFVDKRQELLTGGLARVVQGEGYATPEPVHMEEVSDNLFHVRLAVAEARGR